MKTCTIKGQTFGLLEVPHDSEWATLDIGKRYAILKPFLDELGKEWGKFEKTFTILGSIYRDGEKVMCEGFDPEVIVEKKSEYSSLVGTYSGYFHYQENEYVSGGFKAIDSLVSLLASIDIHLSNPLGEKVINPNTPDERYSDDKGSGEFWDSYEKEYAEAESKVVKEKIIVIQINPQRP